jgi:hypothetical protein
LCTDGRADIFRRYPLDIPSMQREGRHDAPPQHSSIATVSGESLRQTQRGAPA